jgi:hypothetical protein
MDSIVTVTTPAAVTKLAALAAVKRDLNVVGSTEDTYLNELIDGVSAAFETFCARRFAVETIKQTARLDRPIDALVLARFPVRQITEIKVDGVALAAADWEHDPAKGLLWRLDGSGNRRDWDEGKVEVSMQCGYRLPDESGRDLPADLERACIEAVKLRYAAKGRDPALRSVQVEGVGSEDYALPGVAGGMDGEWPASIAEVLARYRDFRA